MRIEIDQSGKIEKTSKLTTIAYSNGKSQSILITAKDKKSIQSLFRKIGQPKIFVCKLFAVLIFVLLKDEFKSQNQIIIDQEYPGYDSLIKDILFDVAKLNNIKIDPKSIAFGCIGRKSKAHTKAIDSFRNKKADIKLSAKEFYKIVFK